MLYYTENCQTWKVKVNLSKSPINVVCTSRTFFSWEKRCKKTKETFPFPFESSKTTKFLENFDERLPSFVPSGLLNNDVNPLINLPKQTIDEETKNDGIKNEHRNCSWFDSSDKNLLKKRNSLFCNLIVPPDEFILNKCKTLRNNFFKVLRLWRGCTFRTVWQNLMKNERLFFKHSSKLSGGKQSTASAMLKETSSVLVKSEEGWVENFYKSSCSIDAGVEKFVKSLSDGRFTANVWNKKRSSFLHDCTAVKFIL